MNNMRRLFSSLRMFGLATTLQMAVSPLRKAYHSARFGNPAVHGPTLWLTTWRALRARNGWSPLPTDAVQPGAVRSHEVHGQTVIVTCEHATIHITILAEDLLRVQLQRPGEALDHFSYAIARTDEQWPPVAFSIRRGEEGIDIATARLVCRVATTPCLLSFHDPHDHRLITGERKATAWHGAAIACSLQLADDEHVYGLGEKAFGLDRRGRAYTMWNSDPNGAYAPGTDPLYLNIPFYIGLNNRRAYGLFFDNTYRSRIDVGAQAADTLTFQAEGGPLRYYLLYGPRLATVLERWSELTGHMRLPPLWALGYHQSRWSYTPDHRVRELAAQFRQQRIPCDTIHLDIHYMDGYRCFTWHPRRFPNPAGLISQLHGWGFKVVPLIDCGIKNDRSYAVCNDGIAHKVFCTYPDGTLFHGPVWPGDCYFPDFTNPATRDWWGRQYRSLLNMGADGIWNDMNEPTVFGWGADTLPDCVRHDWEGNGSNHAQAHNVYGLQMARATADGLAALRPGRRTFVITRSAWAGLQRYAMNWMGDNVSTWEHLRLSIPMMANLGLCGLAFTGPDCGGFAGDCQPELLTRWIQLGVFTPFFRNHSALGTADQEPWVHGEPYQSINRRYIELRYHLLPYFYTTFWQCAQSGMPMLRPLFVHWQEDERTHSLDDEFMFGDALLIAPIGRPGDNQRPVYLPAGVWYDWWTGQRYTGAHTVEVQAPLDHLPIFARAGSVVPAWPVMQYTGERPIDRLTLHVFPGEGQSVLYEDDGETLAYQDGAFRITHFNLNIDQGLLTIERQEEGSFVPMWADVELIVHGVDGVETASADGQALTAWQYEEAMHSLHCRAPWAQKYTFLFTPSVLQ